MDVLKCIFIYTSLNDCLFAAVWQIAGSKEIVTLLQKPQRYTYINVFPLEKEISIHQMATIYVQHKTNKLGLSNEYEIQCGWIVILFST